jgi:serine kinase of HPr protein (carbohydrate metabolism regulator)
VEGIPFVKLSAYDYEQSALYRKLAEQLLAFDTLLFHGSAISVDGEAYLFTAASGTGKSTHTTLWRQTFGDRAVMVNDDKPLLRMVDGKVYVCGTPWNGKHNLGTKITVPLKGLCILERAKQNHIQPITLKEVLPLLMQQSFRPRNPVSVHRVLELLNKLSESTGLYRLGCNMDPEAATVAYQGMNRKED